MENKVLAKFQKTNWVFMYDRYMTYQKVRLFNSSYTNELAKFFNLSLTTWFCSFKNGVGSEYYDKNELDVALKQIKLFLRDEKKLSKVLYLSSLIPKQYRIFNEYIKSMPESYKLSTKSHLKICFKKYLKQEHPFSFINWILFSPVESQIVLALKEELKFFFKDDEVEKILEVLSLPIKPTPLDLFNNDLRKINLKSELDIRRFVKKYKSFGMFDVNYEEYKIENLTRNSEQVGSKHSISPITVKINSNRRRQRNLILKKLSSYKKVYTLAKFFTTYADYKELKNFYREKSSYKLKILLSEIANRFSLSLNTVSFMTDDEILDLFNKNNIVVKNRILARQQKSIYYFYNNLHIISAEETDVFLKTIQTKTEQDFLNGETAFGGLATGKVKIVLSMNDLKKVKNGDVLVTSTTRPGYLSAMALASAIVTNEGGILSHAAIISREIKKPCIIGTKVATKVFKDGDMVEVDADKGIIRKIFK